MLNSLELVVKWIRNNVGVKKVGGNLTFLRIDHCSCGRVSFLIRGMTIYGSWPLLLKVKKD